jgi:Beta-ketoacyl synthase, N-terminal domain
VTVPLRDASSFALQVSDGGSFIQPIGLHGRFHHPIHTEASKNLRELCKQDARFQLPTADCLVLPLRSNANAKLVTEGALHDIALDSILTEQAQWYQTVKTSVIDMGGEKVDIITVGTEGFVPRSVTTGSNSEPAAAGITNGLSAGANTSTQPSLDPIGRVQSGVSTAEVPLGESAIAVIGMACRFPKADSVEEFWQLIGSGATALQPVPKERFNTSELWREPKGPFWGNFLSDPDTFDHRFFGISGREAKSMDPQQRLLLQVAYEAMESSGYCGLQSDTQPSEIGCYIGVGSVDYEDNVASQDATAYSALGTLRAFISGRVSHYFGWTGPSITYDTACSSSAVAIHSACKVSARIPKRSLVLVAYVYKQF